MTEPTIWIGHAETLDNQYHFTPSPGGSRELNEEFKEERDRGLAAYRLMQKGGFLAADDVNTRLFWSTPGRTPFSGAIPPVISNAGVYLRSDVVDVLRRFDLGQAQFFPVEIFDNEKSRPTGAKVWFLNPRNTHTTVDPVLSGLRQPRIGKKVLSYFLVPFSLWRDHAKVMTYRSAMIGADLWIDPALPRALFMTERLARQLIKEGWQEAFQLYPTTLID